MYFNGYDSLQELHLTSAAFKKRDRTTNQKAILAKKEAEKFSEVLENGERSAEMLSIRRNLLRTKLDDEVETNN